MRTPVLLAILGALVLAMQLGLPPAAPSDAPVLRSRAQPASARGTDPLVLAPLPAASASPFDRGDLPADTTAPTAAWALVGLARAGSSTTLLIRDDTSATHVVRPGDQIGSWRVGNLVGDRVELTRGAERRSLSLDGSSTSGPRAPS